MTEALHLPDAHRRTDAHGLLERLLTAGAAGNPSIRAARHQLPELRRATSAVPHTVRYQPPTEHPHTRPVYPGIGTLRNGG